MHVAQHVHEGTLILTIIDSSLVDTIHEEGKKQLDFKSKYYHGSEEDAQSISLLLKKAAVIHAAGEETMALLEKEGFPVEEALFIARIPFAQFIRE